MNKEEYKTYLRQRLNEEDSNGGTIDNHPHGALTRVLARHLEVGASKVFDNIRHLTSDSSQRNVDNAIGDAIDQHGDRVDRLWSKLSAEPSDPYHTPPARYVGTPERDYDAYDARDTASQKQFVRFIDDFTDHIHDNVSTGVHTEFKGTPRYDGVE